MLVKKLVRTLIMTGEMQACKVSKALGEFDKYG